MKKSILTILTLSVLNLSASCINMESSLVCKFSTEDSISNLHKIKGVAYKTTENNTNKIIKSIELDLNNSKETIYLNLSTYTNLSELSIKKNATSRAYIKLNKVIIKIENEIKEVKNEVK